MMSNNWQDFLINAGAEVHDRRVMDFGNANRERQVTVSGEVIADLSHRALIAVRGADAEKFLQGQLSNDIFIVTDQRSQLSMLCSPKGRVLAIFRIFRHNDTLYLALPETLLDTTLERLRKYILMSKVTLEPETTLAQIGYSGNKATQYLRDILNTVPEAVDDAIQAGDVTLIRIPGLHPRYELIGPPSSLTSLWAKLDVHAAPVGADPWELLDILGGVPALTPLTIDQFVPQMLNLDILGGISFKKGCYTGQEIVARTHYLGKLKRRMFRLNCPIDQPPAPGTPLFSTTYRQDEAVGNVVSAQKAPDGDINLLAVLQIEASTQGKLLLGAIDGPPCELQPLPYSVDAAENSPA